MADLIVPTFADPFYRQRSQLDGTEFILSFQFNSREGRWYVDIYDQDEVPLRLGVKVASTREIAAGQYYGRPAGNLACIDQQNPEDPQLSRDPGLKELGERWLLYYFEAA